MDFLEGLSYWHWLVAGVVIAALEILLPGAYLLWLGIGAIATGVVVLAVGTISWKIQFVAFAVLSLASIVIGRRVMRSARVEKTDHPTLNRRAAGLMGRSYVLDDGAPGGHGRVHVGDTVWHVETSPPGQDLPRGARVEVVGVDGATLLVKPQDPA